MADARSSFSRKNPEAALRAFRMAFGRSDAAKLVLKLTGPDEELARFERSVAALLGNDIEILKKQLSDTALADLYRSADAYLSLHRSEGFGLPLLEAMAHGMPVVATGWSGNLDFMPPDDCNLVPFRLVPVSDVSAIYSDSVWADPDIEAAATMLRRLANDTDYYARMAGAAHNCAAVAPSFPFTTPMAARTAPFVEAVA
jgi:glycosyltransferase involved in cell wall biosynthesis